MQSLCVISRPRRKEPLCSQMTLLHATDLIILKFYSQENLIKMETSPESIRSLTLELGTWVISVLQRLRQGDHGFEVSLGYTVRSCHLLAFQARNLDIP